MGPSDRTLRYLFYHINPLYSWGCFHTDRSEPEPTNDNFALTPDYEIQKMQKQCPEFTAAEELSDFLGLSVQELVEYPTVPKVPNSAGRCLSACKASGAELNVEEFIAPPQQKFSTDGDVSSNPSRTDGNRPDYTELRKSVKESFRNATEFLDPKVHAVVTNLCRNIYEWTVGGRLEPPSEGILEKEIRILALYELF